MMKNVDYEPSDLCLFIMLRVAPASNQTLIHHVVGLPLLVSFLYTIFTLFDTTSVEFKLSG